MLMLVIIRGIMLIHCFLIKRFNFFIKKLLSI
jgi:hypothetical protein